MGYFLIQDETFAGLSLGGSRLRIDRDVTTLREIIATRVRDEVGRRNTSRWAQFRAVVGLEGATGPRELSAEAAVAAAIEAFQRNVYFVLAADRQLEDLDEPIPVSAQDQELTFLRITQLVGG